MAVWVWTGLNNGAQSRLSHVTGRFSRTKYVVLVTKALTHPKLGQFPPLNPTKVRVFGTIEVLTYVAAFPSFTGQTSPIWKL